MLVYFPPSFSTSPRIVVRETAGGLDGTAKEDAIESIDCCCCCCCIVSAVVALMLGIAGIAVVNEDVLGDDRGTTEVDRCFRKIAGIRFSFQGVLLAGVDIVGWRETVT